MRKLVCVIVCLSMLAGLCACTHTAEVPETSPEISDEDLYAVDMEEKAWPVIDGSAAFLPYYTAAAARLLEVSEEEASRSVRCSTTEFAYTDLIYGDADLAFCFLPSETIARLASHEGVTLACYPVLNEAFVFCVSPDNPVEDLTLQQLHDIYAGKITNWSEVGGDDEAILPFQLTEGNSGREAMSRFVIPEYELMEAPSILMPGTMGEEGDVTAVYDGSKGALGYGYLHAMQILNEGLDYKLISIDGIAPTEENIFSGAYPFISQVCAVIRGGEEETAAGRFAQWCAWPLGQALAKEKGYIPNMPVEEKETAGEETEQAPPTEHAEVSLSGKTAALQRNDLAVAYSVYQEDDRIYAMGAEVRGFAGSNEEKAVNERIRSKLDRLCDPAFLPDVQGIETYKAAGLVPESCRYKTVYTRVTASSSDLLSIVFTCSMDCEVPAGKDGKTQTLFFNVCETMNIDPATGKDVLISAFAPLASLDGQTGQYLRQNADTVYQDEDTFGPPEGAAPAGVRVTAFPGLNHTQKYYLDAAAGTLYLVLDVETPWAVTGTDFSCLPIELSK